MPTTLSAFDPHHDALRGGMAVDEEKLGRPRMTWDIWEQLRADHPERSEWNGPLLASYLSYAMSWTADAPDRRRGDADDALAALVRALAILAGELGQDGDDLTRWILVARALEQRCILTAFRGGWTAASRDALDGERTHELPAIVGDRRLVRSTAGAARAALDMLATRDDLSATARATLAKAGRRVAAIVSVLDAARRSQPMLVVLRGGLADVPPGRKGAVSSTAAEG